MICSNLLTLTQNGIKFYINLRRRRNKYQTWSLDIQFI